MAKTEGPLFSQDAHGTVADLLTFSARKSCKQVRFQKKQTDVITTARTEHRAVFLAAVAAWNLLNAGEKAVYDTRAVPLKITGYNLFVREYIDSYIVPLEIDYMEYATDEAAQAAYITNALPSPTGGTITTHGTKTVHTFLLGQSGQSFNPGTPGAVEVLVVAGGGSGGVYGAGGGGGGGVIYDASFAVTKQEYTITVGDGGASKVNNGIGNVGNDSVFSTFTAKGGGYGAGGLNADAGVGGSGGGGGYSGRSGGAGTVDQGYAGGDAWAGAPWGSGGGGGKSEVGHNATSTNSGNGGDGSSYTIYDGSTDYYGGGGGGGGTQEGAIVGAGGAGGGSAGVSIGASDAGQDGMGGGSGAANIGGTSGKGGSGIVIISYTTADYGSNALKSYSESTIKTQGSYSLKGVATTGALNKTLTRTIT